MQIRTESGALIFNDDMQIYILPYNYSRDMLLLNGGVVWYIQMDHTMADPEGKIQQRFCLNKNMISDHILAVLGGRKEDYDNIITHILVVTWLDVTNDEVSIMYLPDYHRK